MTQANRPIARPPSLPTDEESSSRTWPKEHGSSPNARWWERVRTLPTFPLVLAATIVGIAILIGLAVALVFGEGTVESRVYAALDWASLVSGVFVAPAMALWASNQGRVFGQQMQDAIDISKNASVESIREVKLELRDSANTTIGQVTHTLEKNLAVVTEATLVQLTGTATSTLEAIHAQSENFRAEVARLKTSILNIETAASALTERLKEQGIPVPSPRLPTRSDADAVADDPSQLLPNPPSPAPDERSIERAVLEALSTAGDGTTGAPLWVSRTALQASLPQDFKWPATVKVLRRLRKAKKLTWSGADEHTPSPQASYQLTADVGRASATGGDDVHGH